MAQAGELSVVVKNPIPGGGISLPGTFTVADCRITAVSSSASVTAGETATFSLSVQSFPSSVTFTNPITFAATGLPAGATDSFTPSGPVILSSSGSTITVAIATAPSTTASANRFPRSNPPILGWICFVGIAVALAGMLIQALGHRRQRPVPQFLWLLLLAAVAGLGACGSSVTGTSTTAPSTPDPVTSSTAYTITVTAACASGAVSHSVPLTLTVM
jgi:hypothetical protein